MNNRFGKIGSVYVIVQGIYIIFINANVLRRPHTAETKLYMHEDTRLHCIELPTPSSSLVSHGRASDLQLVDLAHVAHLLDGAL